MRRPPGGKPLNWSRRLLEFTGERVTPEVADKNLFNEHRARYRLAARFARTCGERASVLDAGCGSGYGVAEFPNSARVVAIDVAADAVRHARENFGRPGAFFLQGACESLSFGDASFDLIAAFEVIEHLERWPEMLREGRRCLKRAGVMLVSTPNKTYYAESRGGSGPNPYHVREFEYAEFADALADVFPHVQIWSQNHVEAIAFVPHVLASGTLDAAGDPDPANAHFFFAVCSSSPIDAAQAFGYVPDAGNALRERGRHIALLEGELERKNGWLLQMEERHAELNRAHDAVIAELEERNAWAERLNDEIEARGSRIAALQSEIIAAHAGYQSKIAGLEGEELARLAWIGDLETQIARGRAEIERLNLEGAELRAAWESIEAELLTRVERREAEMAAMLASKWLRLGRRLHVGPAARK